MKERRDSLRVQLVNMPFSGPQVPSIALTQLKSVLDHSFPGRVETNIIYANQDFFLYLRENDDIDLRALDLREVFNGFGDWFFRQAAFPQLEDNAELYFARYYPRTDPATRKLRRGIAKRRGRINDFLDRLIERYALDQADLVGFTSMFSQNVASFALARRLKRLRPQLITVIGGANCEPPMGGAIIESVSDLDYVFSGPALISFPQFVGRLLSGEPEPAAGIRGVLSGRANSESPKSEMDAMGEELDIDAPVDLDYDSFLDTFERNFPTMERPPVFFETSRGCWWGERAQCTFCGLNGSTLRYRAMSPDKAVWQFETLFERYGSRVSYYFGVDAIMPKNYPTEVFPRVRAPAGAPIFYEVKPDLEEDDLRAMAAAGATKIQPGLEALATSSLKLIRKGTTSFRNLALLKNARRHDIDVTWNLLLGLPGETAEVFEKYVRDIPLLFHLQPPTGAHQIRFDRYSPFFMKPEEFGLDLRPDESYGLVYPFRDDVLERLAYFFTNYNFKAPYYAALGKSFHAVRCAVEDWRRRWSRPEPPTLRFERRTSSMAVLDSRGDELVEHDLGELGARVLQALEKPWRIGDLARRLGGVGFDEVEREVRRLQDHRLLFCEDDRFLSLVLGVDVAETAGVESEPTVSGFGRP